MGWVDCKLGYKVKVIRVVGLEVEGSDMDVVCWGVRVDGRYGKEFYVGKWNWEGSFRVIGGGSYGGIMVGGGCIVECE